MEPTIYSEVGEKKAEVFTRKGGVKEGKRGGNQTNEKVKKGFKSKKCLCLVNKNVGHYKGNRNEGPSQFTVHKREEGEEGLEKKTCPHSIYQNHKKEKGVACWPFSRHLGSKD